MSALSQRFYELAEQNKHIADELAGNSFFDAVFKIGNLQTKIYVCMFLERREWTTNELAEECGNYRQAVFTALKSLEKQKLVIRLGYTRWKAT